MRLFTALDLPAVVVGNLEDLLAKLRPAARIQWSPPSNLHVTTKFIGEWPEARLGELTRALEGLESRAVIQVRIHQLGFYPNPHSPRVFHCGVDAPGLEQLAKDTDGATARLGIESEKRAYSPHLTLARIKEKGNLQTLREAIAALPSRDFGSFSATHFFLYQSTRRPSGSVYTKLAEFPLSK
ncbi:MAG TPA: RNA 2',3'-cyclic phosphodiesterase [Bryobacteraceae bacterium]|nr:RNA 2',3'-cyclic phosphodiesterase [Bryobacteraceae bacterium]